MTITLNQQSQVLAGLAIVGLGVLWGAGFPAIDIIVSQFPPLGAAGIRYAVSGCIVLAYASMATNRILPQTWREILSILIVGGFMFGGYQAGLYLGTQYISGAVAAVITTMSPIIAALIAVPALGESRRRIDAIGFVVGLSGVVVLSQPSIGSGGVSATMLGVGLVFSGTAMFAVGSVSIQLSDGDLPTEALLGWAMLVGTTLLFIVGYLRGESIPEIHTLSSVAIGSLIYITVVSGAVGYLLFFRLVRSIGATETTLVAYIEPMAATLVSILFLSLAVDIGMVVGFLAIAAGFTLVNRTIMWQIVERFC